VEASVGHLKNAETEDAKKILVKVRESTVLLKFEDCIANKLLGKLFIRQFLVRSSKMV
jgi:hypothetical protein